MRLPMTISGRTVGAPALLFSASAADAGTYYVAQTCGAWGPFNNAPARLAVYTECPALVVRNVGGPFSSAAGQEGRWDFYAPPGSPLSGHVPEAI